MAAQKSNSPTMTIVIILGILLIVFGLLLPIINIGSESSPRGFVLPKGDIQQGREAFVELGCVNCHTVHDVVFKDVTRDDSNVGVPLGGIRNRAMSYGRLVTSIIHPSESIEGSDEKNSDGSGASLMPDLTEQMTVSQMIDIVSFLLEHYDVAIPQYEMSLDPYQPYRLN